MYVNLVPLSSNYRQWRQFSLMSSARRCACTVICDASSDFPIPLKTQNAPHTLDDTPLALVMCSDGTSK